MRRGTRTGQTLFPLRIKPGIPRVRPWKELLATGAQATWFSLFILGLASYYYSFYSIFLLLLLLPPPLNDFLLFDTCHFPTLFYLFAFLLILLILLIRH